MVFRCSFSAELWKYGGESSWWFISLPVEDSEDLDQPVAGARVIPSGIGQRNGSSMGWLPAWLKEFTTDEQGVAEIRVPDDKRWHLPAPFGETRIGRGHTMARPSSEHPTELELQSGRDLAHTTVITMLSTMVDKGQIEKLEPLQGKAFRFSPILGRDEVSKGMLGDLASVDLVPVKEHPDQCSIALRLKSESSNWLARRIESYSLWEDPTMVAILFDGKLLGAVNISSPIPEDTLNVPSRLPRQQVEAIVNEIRTAIAQASQATSFEKP